MIDSPARPLFSLTWQSIAYGIGIMGRQFVIYLVLPFFTRYLSQEEFGVVAVTATFLNFALVLVNAGLTPTIFRFFNDTEDVSVQQRILGSSQTLVGGYALFGTLLVIVAADNISTILLGTNNYAGAIRIIGVLLLIESIITYGNVILRIQVRPLASSSVSLSQIILQAIIALVLVRFFGFGVEGYWLGYLIGALLSLLMMIWLVRSSISFKISKFNMKEMLVYALPLYPSVLALWMLRLFDRWLLVSRVGLEEVAVYEIGYKIGLLTGMILAPFMAAWPQFAYSFLEKPKAPKIYSNVLTFIITIVTFISLAVIMFSPELIAVMAPPNYNHATEVIPWIALSQVAWGFYIIMHISFHITKKTYYIAIVTIVAAGVNICLNIALIPPMGIRGAALATTFGYISLAILTYILGFRLYKIPVDWLKLIKVFSAAGIILIAQNLLINFDGPIILEIGYRFLLLFIFPIILLLTGFLTTSQRKMIWQSGMNLVRNQHQQLKRL